MAGDTKRVNPDEPKEGDKGVYMRDTIAMLEVEISKSKDGRIWVNIDGVCWLRVKANANVHCIVTGFD